MPATLPDVTQHFQCQGRTIRVHGWRDVVRADQKVDPDHVTFSAWVFFDPLYHQPLVLGTNLTAQPETIFRLYLDRWPVEQVPPVAKQLLGLERQFVFAPAARQRLPVATPSSRLLAANIITYLGAVLPPLPTGFWDRQPRRTPGRLRRVLAQTGFPQDYPLDERLRKNSRSQRTCPPVLMPIDVRRLRLRPFSVPTRSNRPTLSMCSQPEPGSGRRLLPLWQQVSGN
jgi:hypothetical protein